MGRSTQTSDRAAIRQSSGTLRVFLDDSPTLHSEVKNRRIQHVVRLDFRNCEADGMPYHLFRLLLLYHDPELCTFFDTRKITPDLYAHAWVRSLYAGVCSLEVILKLWDGYFQHADQFFVFFLALVLLMFAK